MRYLLRFFIDNGICLWGANDAARERFGYPIELDDLPLSESTRTAAEDLIARFDTSINQDYPLDPGPWSEEEDAAFLIDARAVLERIREELGPDFDIRDELK